MTTGINTHPHAEVKPDASLLQQKRKRVIGVEADRALEQRRAQAGHEAVALSVGGEEFELLPFVPAAVMMDMLHYGTGGMLKEAIDALAKAFVPEHRERLLTLLGPDSPSPVDMEYVSDLIQVIATELTGRPLESE